jgi:hypothetical protein
VMGMPSPRPIEASAASRVLRNSASARAFSSPHSSMASCTSSSVLRPVLAAMASRWASRSGEANFHAVNLASVAEVSRETQRGLSRELSNPWVLLGSPVAAGITVLD